MRNQLAIQVTNLQVELDHVTAQLDEEAAAAENAQGQLQRVSADLVQLKSKYDKEVATLSEQLDDTRYNHRSVLNILDSLLANQIPANGVVMIVCRIEIQKWRKVN